MCAVKTNVAAQCTQCASYSLDDHVFEVLKMLQAIDDHM